MPAGHAPGRRRAPWDPGKRLGHRVAHFHGTGQGRCAVRRLARRRFRPVRVRVSRARRGREGPRPSAQFEDAHPVRGDHHVLHRLAAGQLAQFPVRRRTDGRSAPRPTGSPATRSGCRPRGPGCRRRRTACRPSPAVRPRRVRRAPRTAGVSAPGWRGPCGQPCAPVDRWPGPYGPRPSRDTAAPGGRARRWRRPVHRPGPPAGRRGCPRDRPRQLRTHSPPDRGRTAGRAGAVVQPSTVRRRVRRLELPKPGTQSDG